ncbi:hypothetical protein XarbCFBP8150_21620, partial [Xanthomonas arboricola]
QRAEHAQRHHQDHRERNRPAFVQRGQTGLLYGLSILIVFLCLAALYESWAIPFSVILVVPLGVFGTLL